MARPDADPSRRRPLARLKRRPEFLAVAAARRKWVAPGLVLQARQRPANEAAGIDPATIRYGITASRKVGNAVARNRAKRRLRAAASEILPVAGPLGYDVVLIARHSTNERPFGDLKTDLERGLARLGGRPRTEQPEPPPS